MQSPDGFEAKTDKGIKRCLQIFNANHNIQFDVFQYNLMKQAIEYKKTPIWREDRFSGDEVTKEDEALIRAHLSNQFNFDAKKTDILDAIIYKSFQNPVYPLRDYLDSLEWDGTPRLDTWLIDSCQADDNVFTRSASRKFLTAAVKRIFVPGCKFDYMLVLEGSQGIRKSSLLKTLGGEWSAQLSIEESNTAIMENMCGKWFIEFDEMSGWTRQDVARIKSLITRQEDRRRVPYGRQSADFKRQCVLAGTLNPKVTNQYLNDETGNRRFWIIECHTKEINLEYIKENRDQLFAEAKHYYNKDEKLWLTNTEEIAISENLQNSRMISDSWEEIVRKRLDHETRPSITVSIILTEYIGMRPERINHSFETRIGIIMSQQKDWNKRQDWRTRQYYFEKNLPISAQPNDEDWDL